MENCIRLNERMVIGAQPTEEDLRELKEQGFGAVVNLRLPNEDAESLSPEAEAQCVRELGMEYLHIPVSGSNFRIEQVDQFSESILALPTPAFVHCRRGMRAAVVALLHEAVEEGWTADETFRRAQEIGCPLNAPPLQEFVRGYLKTRRR